MTQYDDSSAETDIERTNDGTELGAYSVDDEDQPGAESFLLDRGVDDPLDEGYSPPEKPRGVEAFGTTATEEREGETLEQRIQQEEPDPAMAVEDPLADADDTAEGESSEADEFLDEEQVGGRRAGRLVDPDEGVREDTEKDVVGTDVGIDGGAASAEEAAMHVIDEP
jgi:hypothetical protein